MIINHFHEVQKMDSVWPLSVLAITLVVNWVLYFYLGYDDLSVFYFSMATSVLMSIFLWSMRLYTRIDQDGVHVRFFPLRLKWHHIPWSQIKGHNIRKFSAWTEYGGYGIRNGKSGKAYIINGGQGLQLTLKNDEKILIGTSLPEQLELAFGR